MINSPVRTRFATGLAIAALTALLLTPFLFQRHIAQLRRGITSSLEPAREVSSDVGLALSREVGAIRGFLLSQDRELLDEYRAARSSQDEAFRRLAAVGGLDSSIVAGGRNLESAAAQWNALNDSVASGSLPPSGHASWLPAQQRRYREALEAMEGLDRSLSHSLSAARTRIAETERWWAAASVILGVLAAAAAVLVLLMSRGALEQTELARTDPLTGLYNRRGFAELAQRELSRAHRHKSPLTLLTFDLDGFKAVNDQHGHAAGDQLLRSVAEGIRGAIREIDLAGRLGGDEFALMLPDNNGRPPDDVVNRIRATILKRLERDGWPITLSIGAVTVRDTTLDIDAIIHETDALMYQVKATGKNALRHRELVSEATV